MSSNEPDCGCNTAAPIQPSGGMGSCESGLCTPHGTVASGIIHDTGRVTHGDGTPSLFGVSGRSASQPNGAQIFTRGSRAFGSSGCPMPAPSAASFKPSHGAPLALPERSNDYLQVDINREGTIQVFHASGQASSAEDAALIESLYQMSDDQLAASIRSAQQQIQAAVNGITPVGEPAESVAQLLLSLERERSRRASTQPHAPIAAPGGGNIEFIETAGVAVDANYASADAQYGYGASGQAAHTGTGTSTGTGAAGAGAATAANAAGTSTGTTNTGTTTSPDPAMWTAIGQGTNALVTLLNSRLAAGDTDRRESRLQEFQLELERIRRESGGSMTADQSATISTVMGAIAQQQQALAAERAAERAAQDANRRRMMMLLVVLVAIIGAIAAAAWYLTRGKQGDGARSNPSGGRHHGHAGGMSPYERYVAKANRATARAAHR